MHPQTRQFTSLMSVEWVDDVCSCPKTFYLRLLKVTTKNISGFHQIGSPSCEWHLEHREGSESWSVQYWKDGAVG